MKVNTFLRRSINALLFILFAIVPIFSANAWNKVGHRVVAELAWRQMDKNQRQAASELLKHHPHYKQFLAADVPAGADTNEWVFLTAAVWPDWVRPAKHGQPHKPESVTQYDLYPHAIGYPFLRVGDTNQNLIEKFFIAKPDAEMVLSNSIATLKDKKASAHDRAVSLCWTLHLFGDLHQPLHAANLVTREKPNGDSLGGHYIALNLEGKQVDLHSFWDQLPGVNPSYESVVDLADKLAAAPELKPRALKELQENKTIHQWVQESFKLAVNFAYAEDRVQFVHEDELRSGKISASAIPPLKSDYVVEARKIAHRRLVLAAQRLTVELKQVW